MVVPFPERRRLGSGRNEASSLDHVRYEVPLDIQLEMSKRSSDMSLAVKGEARDG